MSDQPADHPGLCQNCAREDEDLAPVTRVYVVPETWDQPGSVTPTNEVELWCFSCRTQYPHEDVEPDDGRPEDEPEAAPQDEPGDNA